MPQKIGDKFGVWLVDATGAYPVRALAVGGGFIESESVAEQVNDCLSKVDFLSMNKEDCMADLIRILGGTVSKDSKIPTIKPGTRLELAFVSSKERRLTRLRLIPDIFQARPEVS